MPTLVIDNVPVAIYERIQLLAKTQHLTPADTVLEVLASALRATTHTEALLPDAPFLTEEVCAPFDIPWPKGEAVVPIEITNYLPEPHDIPETE